MSEWIQHQLDQMTYWTVGWLMVVENLFPPIPSEIVMPSAGYAASRGDLTLAGVIAAGSAGSLVGAVILYYAGRWLGQERLERWAERHGSWLAIGRKDVVKAFDWFERHGGKAVFFGRLVPGVRSLISLPAGAARMPLPAFLLYSGLGSGLWAAALAWGGQRLGKEYESISRWLGPASWVVLGVIALSFVVAVVRRRRQRARAAA